MLGNYCIEHEHYKDIKKSCELILDKMKSTPWEKFNMDKQAKEISDIFSKLWKVHPFKDGNIRTISIFVCKYMETRGINISRAHLTENMKAFRKALIAASANFKKLGDYRKPELLEKIIRQSIGKNLFLEKNNTLNHEKSLMSLDDYVKRVNYKKVNSKLSTLYEKNKDNKDNKDNKGNKDNKSNHDQIR